MTVVGQWTCNRNKEAKRQWNHVFKGWKERSVERSMNHPSFLRRPWSKLTEHSRTIDVKKDVRVKRDQDDTGEPTRGRLEHRCLSLKVLCSF